MAECIRTLCSTFGMPARYGGEEFVIAFPDMAAATLADQKLYEPKDARRNRVVV